MSDVPNEEREEFVKGCEENNNSFSLKIDINKDGINERILVGVYQDKKKKFGRFLLILKETRLGKWKKDFLYECPGEPGFSMLHLQNGQISWHDCDECDPGYNLKIIKGKYILEWYDGSGD
jgi:hypothetical protein